MNFQGNHVLSIDQFDRNSLERVLDVASQMVPYASKQKRCTVLEGAVLGNLFLEPSTRTRVSFGAAFTLLGGQVLETVGQESSSLTKGESLYDTAKVMSGYCDAIAMRHPTNHAVAEFAGGASVPVINGGDGSNEHPTQALLDIYTIQSELRRFNKSIDGMHIAMMGDLKHGRTVHSLSRLLCLFKDLTVTLISPQALGMPAYVIEALEKAGHKVIISDKMSGHLATDIIYQTRIQQERFATPEEADLYRGCYSLNRAIYDEHCREDTVILHPLPRDSRPDANELDNDLNDLENLAVFRQAQNGVLVRMALFALTLGVDDKLTQFEKPVTWFSNKSL